MDLYLGLIVISLKGLIKLLYRLHLIKNLPIGNKLYFIFKIHLMFLKVIKLKDKLKLVKLKIILDN
jgi:hypothetical protein